MQYVWLEPGEVVLPVDFTDTFFRMTPEEQRAYIQRLPKAKGWDLVREYERVQRKRGREG